MVLKRLFAFFICLLIFQLSNAQQDKSARPSGMNLSPSEISKIPVLNFDRIFSRETDGKLKNSTAPKFGYCINTDIDLTKAGMKFISGERAIYLVKIKVKGAKALIPYFDKFLLNEESRLFLYNSDFTRINGAFTESNNSESGYFTAGMITSDEIILEYSKPINVTTNDFVHVNELGIAYRMIPERKSQREFGDAESCQVNVNCSEGQNFSNQKRSVVRIATKANGDIGWCSGTLVNNTKNDCKNYVLTADHCSIDGNANYAATNDFAQWIFYFNFESPDCLNPTSVGTLESNFVTGANLIAQSRDDGGLSGSDFLLLRITSAIPTVYNVYYAGWDASGALPDSGVCIHHPSADIKKISGFKTQPIAASWGGSAVETHLQIGWNQTVNGFGVTEAGSSGAPLFDKDGYVVGSLTGGDSYCATPFNNDYFGRTFYHWNLNDTVLTNRQLKPWLNPDNTAVSKFSGRNACNTSVSDLTTEEFSVNVFPNPGNGIIYISADEEFEVAVFTTEGKMVYSNFGENYYGLSNLSKGIYIVQGSSESKTAIRKVVVY